MRGIELLIANSTDQSELNIGRLQRIANHIGSAESHAFEALFPFAGAEHQNEARVRVKAAHVGEQVFVRTVRKQFFAEDETDRMRRQDLVRLFDGGSAEHVDGKCVKDAQQCIPIFEMGRHD